jgi:hypothetical protein
MRRIADWFTVLRLLLVPVVVWLGLIGEGRLHSRRSGPTRFGQTADR